MKKIPSDIRKWNKRWGTDVKYAFPSSGGAVGVVFVYTQISNWSGADGSSGTYAPKDAAFVIKPIQGSAAPTKFAESILSKIAGTQSPHSVPIKRTHEYAQSLVNMLFKFKNSERDAKLKQRWNEVFEAYNKADTLLIQETQKGIEELGDSYREQGGLTAFLTNRELMFNLGKLFAADALIGNGDRLANMNTGNIIFDTKTNKLCAIDSTTVLTNFNKILEDTSSLSVSGNTTADHWASQDIIKKGWSAVPSAHQQQIYNANPELAIALTPSMPMKMLFNVKDWFTNVFKWHFRSAPDQPSDSVWFQAELWFKEGTDEGIRQIDSKLSGLNWMMMKHKYKSYVTRYGGDPNLDWMNFKIRRKYVKLRKSGMNETQVMTEIQKYVQRKMPEM